MEHGIKMISYINNDRDSGNYSVIIGK